MSTSTPIQFTTIDGTLIGPVNTVNTNFTFVPSGIALRSILFRNGLMMTQPVDAITSGNTVTLATSQLPVE